ncbi:MAG: energy transducer TonB [Desulfamplus sp.]|nr:energy transducer TonB [Desulfamplus sp.]
MAITLIKQTASPNMGIMITVSLVVHLFLFLHIKEIYRLKQDFKKPEPPIKIEVMLQEISKPALIATAPLAVIPSPLVETPPPPLEKPPVEVPPPVVESTPVIPPPPITEDARISQPVIPIPEPVKEKKEKIKVVKKKVIVEQKKKPLKKIQEIKKRVEPIAKVPPMPTPVPLPHSSSPTTTTTQNRVSQKSAAQPVVKATALVKAPIASQSDKLLAKAYFNSMRLMIEKNKRYPQMARRRNQEGSVRVRFIIDSNGNVNSLEIVKACDYESLNKAALEAVRRSAPFAKPPASISRDALKLELTINFKLI